MAAITVDDLIVQRHRPGQDDPFTLSVPHLTLEHGRIYRIAGLSGAGKSTLLRVLASIEWPNSGQIQWSLSGGAVVSSQSDTSEFATMRSRDMSFSFQDAPLIPFLTVRQNLAYRLSLADSSVDRTAILDEVDQRFTEEFGTFFAGLLTSQTKYAQILDSYPYQLSGGMRQRVSLIQSLLPPAKAVFLDEPLSSLDPDTRQEVFRGVLRWWFATRPLLLIIDHDQDDRSLTQITEVNADAEAIWIEREPRSDDRWRASPGPLSRAIGPRRPTTSVPGAPDCP